MLFSTFITPIEVNSRGTLIQHFKFVMLSQLLTVSVTFLTLHNGSKSSELVFWNKIKDRFGFGLKKEQCKLISQILNGKNSLGIFPTGSVSFYVLPLLFNEIKGDGHICLVISPLKSLMIDQIEKANLYNIQAAGIMSKEEMNINTITGFYTLA